MSRRLRRPGEACIASQRLREGPGNRPHGSSPVTTPWGLWPTRPPPQRFASDLSRPDRPAGDLRALRPPFWAWTAHIVRLGPISSGRPRQPQRPNVLHRAQKPWTAEGKECGQFQKGSAHVKSLSRRRLTERGGKVALSRRSWPAPRPSEFRRRSGMQRARSV
jgi:hypothetical protein